MCRPKASHEPKMASRTSPRPHIENPMANQTLSGIWQADEPNRKYIQNLAADFKPGEFPIQTWAEALTRERQTDAGQSQLPATHCLPLGIPLLDTSGATQGGYPLKIIQEPDLMVILYEASKEFRQIFLDGRTPAEDANPTWLGYSVGHWEDDTLVVDT